MTDTDAFGTEGRPVGLADDEAGYGRRAGDDPSSRPEPGDAAAAAAPARPGGPRWVPLVVADVALLVVGFVALLVIGVQSYGDADMASRRLAWYENLAVFFGLGAIFAGVAIVLFRSRIVRISVVQGVLALALLGAGVTAAVNGDPKPAVVNPDNVPVPSESPSFVG